MNEYYIRLSLIWQGALFTRIVNISANTGYSALTEVLNYLDDIRANEHKYYDLCGMNIKEQTTAQDLADYYIKDLKCIPNKQYQTKKVIKRRV